MSKKLTIEEMQKIAYSNNGECLSNRYINGKTKLIWKCSKGHIWKATPISVKYGCWCNACSHNIPSIEDMHKLAHSRKGKCLSQKYIDGHTHLIWECSKGHIWKARPDSIKEGSWCKKCISQNQKLTLKEMQNIAKSNGGKCISKEYIGNHTYLTWKCSKGHIWKAIPDSIKRGSWCKNCAGTEKLTLKEMQNIAKSKGGKCLSKKYINGKTKLKWKCSKGHIWKAIGDSVKRGRWCKRCAGNQRLTLQDVQNFAKSKGGECLSKKYINARTNLIWKCSKGHTWEAVLGHIKSGTWCPICKDYRFESKSREIFEKLTGLKFIKKKHNWIQGFNNKPLELDGYCEKLKLAFEYQGEQHYNYKPGRFHKSKEEFQEQIKRDTHKRKICKMHNVKLIEIPYTVPYKELEPYISAKLKNIFKKR